MYCLMTVAAADTSKHPAAQAIADADGNPLLVVAPVSTYRVPAAAGSTNAAVIKASAARLHKLHVNGAAGQAIYVKLYNKATTPSEADTPVFTIAVTDGPVTHDFGGHVFSAGLGVRAVLNAADNDTTALTANDFLGLNIQYT